MTTSVNEVPFSAGASKGYKGMGMEGPIARWYANIAGKNLKQFKEWARTVADNVPIDGCVLEVAPGPGYLAIELAKLGRYKMAGLDISKTFVEIARKKAAEEGVAVDFRQGDAAHMPFDGERFDFVVCTAAFKNFSDPIGALNEMWRVLRPSGKALIVDLRRDVPKESVDKFVNGMGLNKINSLMTKLIFRFMLIKRAYTKAEFNEFVSKAKFSRCRIQESLTGFEIWLEK